MPATIALGAATVIRVFVLLEITAYSVPNSTFKPTLFAFTGKPVPTILTTAPPGEVPVVGVNEAIISGILIGVNPLLVSA